MKYSFVFFLTGFNQCFDVTSAASSNLFWQSLHVYQVKQNPLEGNLKLEI